MENNKLDSAYTSFLGSGWSFPPEFSRDARKLIMVSDEDDIEESLKILFGSAGGERFLNPKYGLDMLEMLFEPMSVTMTTYLEDRVKTAILIHEPRIDLLSLKLDTTAQNEGKIDILVEYEVRATNSRYNLVYPFYTSDGNEIANRAG